mmetsp:Transcript_19380/g.40098  ORF Transcript_19380/g.40098 Transcript_19380/m.40098 type:complete len:783 (+) Transcript_19380:243-2591(+)
MSDLTFIDATHKAKSLSSLSNETKLLIYGTYKASTAGSVTADRPGRFDPVGRAKYDAWEAANKRYPTKEEAKKAYISLVDGLTDDNDNKDNKKTTDNGTDETSSSSPTTASSTTASSTRLSQLEATVASLRAELALASQRSSCAPSSREQQHPAVVKSGYLNKWRDRSIGWSGSKWSLRYVTLTADGRLLYAGRHTEAARATLSLKRCAVKDDGVKRSRGEEFHVFSVYRRPDGSPGEGGKESAQEDDEDRIVPLMRFSTAARADKDSWMSYLSEGCASFDPRPAADRPKGTLAPIYFGDSISPSMAMYSKRASKPKAAHSKNKSVTSFQPSRPMHRSSKPSYLSEGGGNQNYRGLLNLAAIVLIVSNFRLIYDTMKKNGILVTVPSASDFLEAPLRDFPAHSGTLLLNVFVVAAWGIEKLLSRGVLGESVGTFLHLSNAFVALVVPGVVVWAFRPTPGASAGLLMCGTILWMKLISYYHTNSDYRVGGELSKLSSPLVTDLAEDEVSKTYPENVTLKNIYYFWFAPTLTYQIAFPKAPHGVRLSYVFGVLVRMSISAALIVFLVKQTVFPTVDRLVANLQAGRLDPLEAAESLVKLAIPNTYIWLLVFYFYFHLFMNLLAELLCFGDRVFYKDWWNCTEIGSYWRLWNLPVHMWMVRHLYMPAIRSNIPPTAANLIVFLFSAVLHEYLISVPFHMVRFWAFFGMLGQIPLVYATKYLDRKFKGSSVGNVIFWLSFCVLGQPCAILLYSIDYAQLSEGAGAATDVSSGAEAMLEVGVGGGEL